MDDQIARLRNAVVAGLASGVVAGLVFSIVAWLLRVVPGLATTARGPIVIVGGAALALGVAVSRVVERVAGFCGEILLIPITGAAIVAAVVALTLVDKFVAPGNTTAYAVIAPGCLILWLMAAFRVVSARFR
jgi:hypothetical protein